MIKNKSFKVFAGLLISLIITPVFAEGNHNHSLKDNEKKTVEKKATIQAVLSPKMDSYPKMKPVKFILKLSKQDKPLEKATVSFDLTMPSMYMPKNEVKLKESSKGTYEGEAMFTMSGDWRINTSIMKDNKKEMLYFDVKVD